MSLLDLYRKRLRGEYSTGPHSPSTSVTLSQEMIQKAIGKSGLEKFRPISEAKGIQRVVSQEPIKFEPKEMAQPTPEPIKPEPKGWIPQTPEPIKLEPKGMIQPTQEPIKPEPKGWIPQTPEPIKLEPKEMAQPTQEPIKEIKKVMKVVPQEPIKPTKEIQKGVSPYGGGDIIKPTKEIKRAVPKEPRRDFMHRQNVMLKRELVGIEKRLRGRNREEGRIRRMIQGEQNRLSKRYSRSPEEMHVIKLGLGSLYNQRRVIRTGTQSLINRRSEIMNQFDRGRLSNFGKR